MGSGRLPVALNALPPVDVVLIPPDHDDHLDWPTIRALARLELPIVTPLGVGAHLQGWGLPAGRLTGLDGWESCCLSGANGGGLTVGPAHALEAHAPLGGGAFLPVYWGTVSLALHAGVNRCSRRGWPLCCRGGARWTAPPRRPAALPRQPPP